MTPECASSVRHAAEGDHKVVRNQWQCHKMVKNHLDQKKKSQQRKLIFLKTLSKVFPSLSVEFILELFSPSFVKWKYHKISFPIKLFYYQNKQPLKIYPRGHGSVSTRTNCSKKKEENNSHRQCQGWHYCTAPHLEHVWMACGWSLSGYLLSMTP